MSAYYNEIDLYAAEWLRNLIKAGHIADGEVDTRSIVDVKPDDLKQFTQCHFFAGIAGWSHALRLAGWSDDRQIWTGSCPCQPFSVAGQGKGTDDPRHLWPHFFRLIKGCRPSVIMGEQVAGAAGYGWLDGVRSDLESENYAIEGVDIPACSVNAPHIRQRLYWVAHTEYARWDAKRLRGHGEAGLSMGEGQASSAVRSGEDGAYNLADTNSEQLRKGHAREPISPSSSNEGEAWERQRVRADVGADGDTIASNVADSATQRRQCEQSERPSSIQQVVAGEREIGEQFSSLRSGVLRDDLADTQSERESSRASECSEYSRGGEFMAGSESWGYGINSRISSFWDNAIWLNGADGKTRRAQPDICLLAHGVPARVGKLRAYGNAIVPPLAAEVIKAFMES